MPKDVSSREDDWFLKQERELLEKTRHERAKEIESRLAQEKAEETERLKQAHWMKCPKCGHDMEAVNIEGIELDRCTLCEGLYFDHGELEAMLLRRQDKRFKFYRRLFGLD